MKRYGNLWQTICSMDNLRLAHQNARRKKTFYREVKMVDANPDYYLKQIQDSFLNHTYKTSEYVIFNRREGRKMREIYKLPYFPDRIAQWAVIQVIEPILIRHMTADTYSAIPGRGPQKAIRKMQKAIHVDKEGTKYCLKIDMRKYYHSIPRDRLKATLATIFKDKDLLWFLSEIIDSTPGETGVPIGNYCSQYEGNIYLSSMDHWLKEEKKVKHYYRYMDDIVILGSSKEELHRLYHDIDKYATEKLGLFIKDNWQVFPTAVRGVDFLGARVFDGYILLRKSIVNNMKRRLKRINEKLERKGTISYGDFCSICSYEGWMIMGDCYRLHEKYILPLSEARERYYKEIILGGLS